MSYLLDNFGIIMIKLFETYYYKLNNIENSIIDSNITLYAHKDRVWFFVVWENKWNYILKIYWQIPKTTIFNLSELYSFRNWIIKIDILEKYNKFLFVKADKKLENSEFLMYLSKYKIENNYLIWPYLDNIIWNIVADNFNHFCNIYHSIDEESKLLYSNFSSEWISIVLDTIWQDYTDERIDLDKIYNISTTNFSINKELDFTETKNIKLELPFKTEIDFINTKNKYFLLCPIENGHCPDSKVKLSTLEIYINFLWRLIKKLNEKNTCDMS